ncbi:hypothetical protein C5167_050304 [Papaver somniferum]|uniref:Uncharacterized protein n=1 Tax=Papaver somniferum TaxID=3469 RepID=A0A4Y7KNA6_PAPSO|nr:hypothetical protein C5167_050304 [Papaver somniferum]
METEVQHDQYSARIATNWKLTFQTNFVGDGSKSSKADYSGRYRLCKQVSLNRGPGTD